MASTAQDRYYDNPYTDFDASASNEFLKEEGGMYKISDDFQSRIRHKVQEMLHNISHHEKAVIQSGTSVYTGAAGVAMLLQFAGKRLDQKHLNQAAKSFIRKCFYKANRSRINFLNGYSGILILNALINSTDSDSQEHLNESLQEMQAQVKHPASDMPDELLYGNVGYLFSLLFVIENKLSSPFNDSDIADVVKIIIKSGRDLSVKEKAKPPLKYKWHSKNYYGAAHGVAGILYLLLQAKKYLSETDLTNYIKPTLDDLMEQRFSSGNLMSSEGSSSDRLVQWCHGAPGAVALLCTAYETFKDKRYLTNAMECGEVIWRQGLLRKGCGLCHGTSGNAYAFLSLYQLLESQPEFSETDAAKYLYRACAFADWCLESENHQEKPADRPYSLYEGLAGTVYFLIDLLEPRHAAFPGYTVKSLE